MNDDEIIEQMKDFITNEERETQAKRLLGDSKSKSDIVDKTLKKLDELIKNDIMG